MPKIQIPPWFETRRTFRRLTVQIKRPKNGNSITPEYLYKFGLREHLYCECEETSTGGVNHIYLLCKNNT